MPWGRHWGVEGGVPCQVQPGGGVPCQVQPGGWDGVLYLGGTLLGGAYPARGEGGIKVGYPLAGYPPAPLARSGSGGVYPVRTTEGVVTTRRAVCLLRSRRRTFLSWSETFVVKTIYSMLVKSMVFRQHWQ